MKNAPSKKYYFDSDKRVRKSCGSLLFVALTNYRENKQKKSLA